MPHQILLCIVHLLIWCTTIFLLIAIVSLIKSKLNNFVIIFYFIFLKLMHLSWLDTPIHASSPSHKFLFIKIIGYDQFHLRLSLLSTLLSTFSQLQQRHLPPPPPRATHSLASSFSLVRNPLHNLFTPSTT